MSQAEGKAETPKAETQKAETTAGIVKRAARASKKGIAQRIPAAIRRELEKEIASAPEVTRAWLAELDEKFELGRNYAVTKSGVRGFVYRVRARQGKEAKSLRERQEWVETLLKDVLGDKGKNNPRLLEQHAFLVIVAVLYERLATHGKDIPTEELAALSKMLVEQRRAEAQSRNEFEKEPGPQPGRPESELREDFGEAVKQVYGAGSQE